MNLNVNGHLFTRKICDCFILDENQLLITFNQDSDNAGASILFTNEELLKILLATLEVAK